jgi:hypothetical protein
LWAFSGFLAKVCWVYLVRSYFWNGFCCFPWFFSPSLCRSRSKLLKSRICYYWWISLSHLLLLLFFSKEFSSLYFSSRELEFMIYLASKSITKGAFSYWEPWRGSSWGCLKNSYFSSNPVNFIWLLLWVWAPDVNSLFTIQFEFRFICWFG